MLVDTGAEISVIRKALVEKLRLKIEQANPRFKGAIGETFVVGKGYA